MNISNPIPISKALDANNISYDFSRASINIHCPFCDVVGTKDKRLNINLSKNMFRCPKCGEAGGTPHLYGLLKYHIRPSSMTKEDIASFINEINGKFFGESIPKNKIIYEQPTYTKIDVPVISTAERNVTYNKLFDKLSLSNDHYNNLIERGLREIDIIKNKYRTTPLVGFTKIPTELRKEACDLEGVPGFYKNNNAWNWIKTERGFYIPVRELPDNPFIQTERLIQGIQVRRDAGSSKERYRWVSTRDYEKGSGAETWCHFCGYPEQTVDITEGPLKADIIYRFTESPIIAIPGVQSTSHLKILLEKLYKMGVKRIRILLDMDFITNQYVKEAYDKLIIIIKEYGFICEPVAWDPNFKGYDDYLLNKYLERGGKLDSRKD